MGDSPAQIPRNALKHLHLRRNTLPLKFQTFQRLQTPIHLILAASLVTGFVRAQLGLKPKWCRSYRCLVPRQTLGKIWDKHNQSLQGPSVGGKVTLRNALQEASVVPEIPGADWRWELAAQLWAAGVFQISCTAPAHPQCPQQPTEECQTGWKRLRIKYYKNADVARACHTAQWRK